MSLGVKFDPTLSFDQHSKGTCFEERYIAKIVCFLSRADAETLIHAFVSSKLDNCNVLLSGLPRASMKSVQGVQNAAA